jgi:hypothetical protein
MCALSFLFACAAGLSSKNVCAWFFVFYLRAQLVLVVSMCALSFCLHAQLVLVVVTWCAQVFLCFSKSSKFVCAVLFMCVQFLICVRSWSY